MMHAERSGILFFLYCRMPGSRAGYGRETMKSMLPRLPEERC